MEVERAGRARDQLYLRAPHEGGARIAVTDIRGEQIAQLERPSKAGLNRVLWNMRPSAGSGRGPWPASGRGERGAALPAAEYRITVDVGGQQQIVIGRIRDRIVN